jgi:hypothetical protein
MDCKYDWQPLFWAVILEPKTEELPHQIVKARRAMTARYAKLADIEANWEERRKIYEALEALEAVNKRHFNSSDPPKVSDLLKASSAAIRKQ